MNLNISQWKTFTIKKLFPKLVVGSANQGMLSEGSDCFYVGAKRNDNGVMLHCQRDEDLILKGNCVIFICNGEGSVGYANYMDRDFIGTTDIVAGYNENLNYLNGVFLATVISKERPKYSFGRKWKTHLKDTEIKLPIQHNIDGSVLIDDTHEYSDEGYIPDWKFMEDYIKGLHCKAITTKNKKDKVPYLNVAEWEEFRIGDLFDIRPTKFINEVSSDNCVGYGTPLVVNSAENNGVAGYCNIEPTEEGNIITFSDTTDGNTFFYQPKPFIGFAHVQGMYPRIKNIDKYAMLFISTMLMFDSKGRYNYGRKMRRDTISEVMLKLPAILNPQTNKYEPNWQFMENYIKSLPYGDRI